MAGVTGNIYCGLHEYEDMAFVLHGLRPGDLFVDVGANVGSYSLLAGATGADGIAIETIPATYNWLKRNIKANHFEGFIEALNVGLGDIASELEFSTDQGTVNHVLAAGEKKSNSVKVPVLRLDDVLDGRTATIIKIDVEGYEKMVIEGARETLSNPNLLAVIIELNGSGSRYEMNDDDIHRALLEFGFESNTYQPFQRSISSLSGKRSALSNTLYIKDDRSIKERIDSSKKFRIGSNQNI